MRFVLFFLIILYLLCICREKVYIEVQDVNEFVPHWKEEMYIREVEEQQMIDQILQLEAVDEDGSSDLSRICHYHINTPDVPFKVDSHGMSHYNTVVSLIVMVTLMCEMVPMYDILLV